MGPSPAINDSLIEDIQIKMKIVYGVQGYGRGHVSRALAIIPRLIRQGHKVRIFAGGAAYEFLKKSFDAIKIPFLCNHYRPGDGQPSFWLTARKLLPHIGQLYLGAALGIKTGSFRRVYDAMRKFDPDLVVTDFENWTRVAGNRMGVPVISLDHAAIIAYCDVDVPPGKLFSRALTRYAYRLLVLLSGGVDKIIASSFYYAKPQDKKVEVVGPVIREEVKNARSTNDGHFLVYLNQPNAFTPRLESCLKKLEIPVIIYGVQDKREKYGNIEFKSLDPKIFVNDLASCRAIVTRAGNQLFGETAHLGKPVACFPEATFEQRMNAHYVNKMGFGLVGELDEADDGYFSEFLKKEDRLRKAAVEISFKDSTVRILEIINSFDNGPGPG